MLLSSVCDLLIGGSIIQVPLRGILCFSRCWRFTRLELHLRLCGPGRLLLVLISVIIVVFLSGLLLLLGFGFNLTDLVLFFDLVKQLLLILAGLRLAFREQLIQFISICLLIKNQRVLDLR